MRNYWMDHMRRQYFGHFPSSVSFSPFSPPILPSHSTSLHVRDAQTPPLFLHPIFLRHRFSPSFKTSTFHQFHLLAGSRNTHYKLIEESAESFRKWSESVAILPRRGEEQYLYCIRNVTIYIYSGYLCYQAGKWFFNKLFLPQILLGKGLSKEEKVLVMFRTRSRYDSSFSCWRF